MLKWQMADSITDFFQRTKGDRLENTMALISGLMTESSVQSAMGMGGAIGAAAVTGGNPLAAGVGMGAIAGQNEFQAAYLGELRERLGEGEITGERIVEILQDEDFQKEAERKATIRGATIGTVEGGVAALSFGIANALLPKEATSFGARKLLGRGLASTAAESGVGAAGGAGGEFLARLFSGEDVWTPEARKEIFAEGLAELGHAPAGTVHAGARAAVRSFSGTDASVATDSATTSEASTRDAPLRAREGAEAILGPEGEPSILAMPARELTPAEKVEAAPDPSSPPVDETPVESAPIQITPDQQPDPIADEVAPTQEEAQATPEVSTEESAAIDPDPQSAAESVEAGAVEALESPAMQRLEQI
jgi:hypothetical protein